MSAVTAAAMPPVVILVESENLLRSTSAGVARQVGLARVMEFSNLEAALAYLAREQADALLLAINDESDLQTLGRIRAGTARCRHDIPVAVMIGHCDSELALRLRALQVRRIMLKPFRVKLIVETLAALTGGTPAPATG